MKGTYLIVISNPLALKRLMEEYDQLGLAAKSCKCVSQGNAFIARDVLRDAGFTGGTDFYLVKRKVKEDG